MTVAPASTGPRLLLDAWRLAVGTLTAIPMHPPRGVDRRVAGLAIAMAPIAVVPLGAAVGLLALTGLPMLIKGVLAVAVLALGTRAFHLDGLSDTVDGLAASYDRERSLAVMKSGAAGPAGVVALIVVMGLQAIGFAYGLHGWRGGLLAAVAVCVSRLALASCCTRGVPSARPGGLGDTFTQTVPTAVTVLWWTAAAVALTFAAHEAGLDWGRGVLATLVAFHVVVALIIHARKRLGGVTGDIFGAGIELALAGLLVVLA
ncbi:adenosylcobinamide-GDP ribazoletransferase [Nocardioides baekrokdamisoli]|uniref:Adenosylcobinamide-GDP ribazoletransferase n=1 Tax=Nocardioides baekrokdamisoli TaxID=1804624 RepID=A0A3G9IBI4_9ACTN|nr:adenosylcobinamide-GDP ribazoletransferase [Nocardioides baekrokdamisoli]BBH16207.1 adenosylcobinamide-GDP ribazoletransferase [Nocardioides baekrokdamisoli]